MSDRVSPPAQHAVLATSDNEHASHGHHTWDEHALHTSHEHASVPATSTSINENSNKALTMMHDQMVALAKTKETYSEARELALELLERPELPFAIRVRAHIILARGKEDCVHHAQEAVRLAEKGREAFGPGSTPRARAAVEGLLKKARETLRRAELDMAECERIKAGLKEGSIKKAEGEKIIYGGTYDESDGEESGESVEEAAVEHTGDSENEGGEEVGIEPTADVEDEEEKEVGVEGEGEGKTGVAPASDPVQSLEDPDQSECIAGQEHSKP